MTLALLSGSLIAYVGPGPGLSMGAALIGLVATVFVAILAVFSWPIRVAIRKMRGIEPEEASDVDEDADEEE